MNFTKFYKSRRSVLWKATLLFTLVSSSLIAADQLSMYWNPGPAPVRYLLMMTANLYRLIQEIHAMQSRTPATLRAMFRKFDSELVKR